MSTCECVRVKHFLTPPSFPLAFVYLKRISERWPGDQVIWETFERNGGISPGLSSALTGFKPLCQMGRSQHLCSQMQTSMLTEASPSEIQNKSFHSEFKISCKVGPLRNSAFSITKKEFYRFSKLARVLKLIENFHISWYDFVIEVV